MKNVTLLALGLILILTACKEKDDAAKQSNERMEQVREKHSGEHCEKRLQYVSKHVDATEKLAMSVRDLTGEMRTWFDAGMPSPELLAEHSSMVGLNERAAKLVEKCSGHRQAFESQLALVSEDLKKEHAGVVSLLAGDDGRWSGLRCEDLANVGQHETYTAATEAMDAWREEWQKRMDTAVSECSKPRPAQGN
jgi:hypothetical protein